MPKYNTPHWTNGPINKLKGLKLAERLNELREKANIHHQQATEAWKGFLEHAREAGEALLEAKRRRGHRTKWTKWRNRNFEGSKETACAYMRVAREWNNPTVEAARENGLTINSINKFNKLLRGQPLTTKSKGKSISEQEREEKRMRLRRDFAEKLRKLTDCELEVLGDFDGISLPVFDRLWGKLFVGVKHNVEIVYGDVYDDDKAEKENEAVVKKIHDALNKGGKGRLRKKVTAK